MFLPGIDHCPDPCPALRLPLVLGFLQGCQPAVEGDFLGDLALAVDWNCDACSDSEAGHVCPGHFYRPGTFDFDLGFDET
jgi:hypothetical protein